MKRAAAVLLLTAAAALAADSAAETCQAQGGCMMITQHAYDFLNAEIERLRRALAEQKRMQCA